MMVSISWTAVSQDAKMTLIYTGILLYVYITGKSVYIICKQRSILTIKLTVVSVANVVLLFSNVDISHIILLLSYH